MEKIAQIVVSINNSNVDKPFSYLIPEFLSEKAVLGSRVVVPFGKANRPVEGFILDIIDFEDKGIPLKSILSFPDKSPMFGKDMLELAHWMKEKYYSTLTECLKCIMPAGISIKTDTIYTLCENIDEEINDESQKVLDYIFEKIRVTKADIGNIFGKKGENILLALVKKGIVSKNSHTNAKNFVQYEKILKIAENDSNMKLLKAGTKQFQAFEYIKQNQGVSFKAAKIALNMTDSPIKSLEEKGLILIEKKEIRRKVLTSYDESIPKPHLTNEQQVAFSAIKDMFEIEEKIPILLHGVTGSGKTEVYMQAIEHALNQGKQGIVLVPEISLTPQTVGRFKARFGEKISVTHSKLTQSERFDQWKNAAEGKTQVMIGPRSALFAPFSDLGIIIIDEEHEHTYKSETNPKYDSRQVAIKRGEISGAVVVFGSATPSVESYFLAEKGDYTLVNMPERINGAMPNVEIADMRHELLEGNRSIFSKILMEAIENNLENGLQTILFLNRRGHSTFVSCRQCGYVVKCDDCNINFTYHLFTDKVICHYCGKEEIPPKNCPQCGSKYIRHFGVGTQKVEEEVKKFFPNARVLRMDADTTSGKNSHERILNSFRNGDADILVGTQMIAKGLDFPRVTLVGVVAADISLNSSDYRSGETTFGLLTQVAGRSGRANYRGNVIIQTYNPEHYAVKYSVNGDYKGFFAHEIALRRQMNYPPYSHIFTILITGDSEKNIIELLYKLCDIMNMHNSKGDFELLGPAPAFVSKIKKRYRWRLIVKGEDETRLKNYVLYCVEKLTKSEAILTDINISLTLDPLSSV